MPAATGPSLRAAVPPGLPWTRACLSRKAQIGSLPLGKAPLCLSGPGHGGDGGDGDAEDDNKASDDDLAATRGPFLPQVRSPRHLI